MRTPSYSLSLLTRTQISLAVCSFFITSAWSQTLPSAGQLNKALELPTPQREASPINNGAALPAIRGSLPDAVSVLVKGFRFSGNAAIATPELYALIAESMNKRLDFAALDRVTDVVSRYYRQKGFTVARAYLPAQQSADGIIQINVIEGHYSAINLKNTSPIQSERLEQMLANNLCSVANNKDCVGKLIQDQGLERAILLLKDLPGVTAVANLKPGAATGTSELDVAVRGTKPNSYSVGFDNYGAASTGVYRLNASADLNNLNSDGDQLNLGLATTTKTATKTGSAAYSVPIGYEGQRLGLAFSRSQYRLGGVFDATQSYGLSNALSAYTSYPVIRSVNRSLYARLAGEVRGGVNYVGAAGNSFTSNANVVRLGVTGDNIDSLGGGGYTVYGGTWSAGYVGNTDTTTNSAGRFSKFTYHLARQQSTIGALTLYGSFNAQRASRNLDGSEQTGLGGPGSVRGYAGEAGGSTGANATIEVRYAMPMKIGDDVSSVIYGLFVDRGWVRFYEDVPTSTGSGASLGGANTRALSSYGLTLTLQSQARIPTPTSWGYFLKGMYGMHSDKDPSTLDPSSKGKLWVQGGVNF